MGSVLTHVTRNVDTTSQLVLAANNDRRVLILQNKHASQTIRYKFGAALNTAATEVQTINFAQTPVAGTFKVQWNAVKTAAINWNDNAGTVQTKLRAVAGLDAVTVSGDIPTGLVVTMTGAYPNPTGNCDALVITDNLLEYVVAAEQQSVTVSSVPTNGTYKLTYGGESTSALNFNDNAATVQAALRMLTGLGSVTVAGSFATAFTVTFTGVYGDLALMTISENSLNIPAVIEQQTITTNDVPTNGSFKLSYGGETTGAINYDATAGDIQTALRLLTGLGSVTVAGSWATAMTVTFTGVSGDLALLVVSENSLNIPAIVEQQTLTFEAVPTAGNFKLTYGALTTAAIAYNADAAAVQAALRLLAGLGSITVAGSMATAFTVTFTGVSGDATLLSITDNTLSIPAVTEIQTVTFNVVPSFGVFKLNYDGEATADINYNDNAATVQTKLRAITEFASVAVVGDFASGFAVTMTGVVGNIALMTVTDNTLDRLAVTEQQTITVSSIPTNGSYKLNYGGETTGALAYNATAGDVQTALRLLTGLASITVAGSFATQFTITFTGVSGDLALITVSDNTLNIPAVTEIQNLAFSAVPDAGSFRVSYGGVNTALMNENADAAEFQTKLRAIPALASVTVAGSFAASFDVTFAGVSGNALMLVEVDNDLENTGAPITITITETTPGSVIVNITPVLAESVKGVTQANCTPTVTETVAGVTENASIDITPAESVKGVAGVAITPVPAESVKGSAIVNITPVVAEVVKGDDDPVSVTVTETTPGVVADGFSLAAGAVKEFLDETTCPIGAVYMLGSGTNTPVEIAHG